MAHGSEGSTCFRARSGDYHAPALFSIGGSMSARRCVGRRVFRFFRVINPVAGRIDN